MVKGNFRIEEPVERCSENRFNSKWEVKQVGEFASCVAGGTPSTLVPAFWNGTIRWMNSGELNLKVVTEVEGRITERGLNESSTKLLPSQSVLIGLAGQGKTRGTVAISRVELCTNQSIAAICPNEAFVPEFLYHCLDAQYERLRELSSGGGGRGGLTIEIILSVAVPFPPIDEQRAIAAALSDVDGLLDSLDALIAKNQAVKQATMQQLLTGRTRFPGFSGQWEMKRLGDILTFLTTASNPRSDLGDDGGASYIHYGDVHALSYPVLDCARQGLPSIDRALVERITPVRDSDLVMVDASEDLDGIGKSVEIRGAQDKTVISGLHTILCRGHSQFWATGFKAYLQFIPAFRNKLVRVATGISVYGISKNQLAEITLMLPAKREQAAIAAVLSDMDAEINALERRRDKTAAIKQAMMQELLTGRVRLVEAR